jgi:predicted ATPase/transcriptional regulator with XRE-family HTH domain
METTQNASPFGHLLRQYRATTGLTQEALAERSGLGVRSIQALEAGIRHPHRETLDGLERALGLVPDQRTVLERAAQFPRPVHHPRLRPPARDLGSRRSGAQPAPRHNLPAQLTSFIGREQEIADIKGLLATTRLLTLTGIGGCGKTRLALQVALDLLPAFPDGIWLVELAPVSDPALVPRVIATAVGIQEQPGQGILETLLFALGPRRALLLFDTCEHLIETGACLADTLLRGCPGVQILATSREALGIGGEVSWPVPPLAVPPADAGLPHEWLGSFAAIRLFVERAAAVRPGLRLSERNATAIAEICRRLDGLPLAIELAAARVKGLAPEEIVARLDQRFRLLTGGSRAALPRQQTLAATIDWSYGLLSAPERILFNRLSVFVGGFTLEAAESVCGDAPLPPAPSPTREEGASVQPEDVLGTLLRLVDRSLVVVGEGPDGKRRYRLLDTLRQYGRERLVANGEAEELHQRHAAYFLARAEQAERETYGARQGDWLGWFQAEHDNLRAAVRWWIDAGAADQALRLATALGRFCYVFRYLGEGYESLRQALALGAADLATRARALWMAGRFAEMVGELAAERQCVEELWRIASDLNDPGLMIRAWLGRADVDYDPCAEDDSPEVQTFQAEMLRWARLSGEPEMVAGVRWIIGCGRMRYGDGLAGRADLEETVAIYRALGDRVDLIIPLNNLGNIAAFGGDLATARACCEESVAIAQELLGWRGSADALENLGLIALLEGKHAEAGGLIRESIRVRREIGEMSGLPWGFERLAGVASGAGQPERALRLGAIAPKLREDYGFPLHPAWQPQVEGWLATAQAALGGSDSAAARAARAEGQTMSLEQAVAYALEGDDR